MSEIETPRFSILCVDDEDENVQMLAQLLRPRYTVFTAHSAEEGFALLNQHRVEAIISDQRIPVMTGLEFLHEVRRQHEDILLIMISGYLDLDLVIEAVNQERIHGYFQKPLDQTAMFRFLDREFLRYKTQLENRELLARLKTLSADLHRMNETKSDFLRLMSHEFQSPIAILVGNIEILERGLTTLTTPDQKRMLETVKEQSHFLAGIMRRILFLTDLETSDQGIQRQTFFLSGLLGELVEEIRNSSVQAGIDFSYQSDPELWVNADPQAVSTAVRLILENAVRFSPFGGKVSLQVAEKDGKALIRVCDNGMGIPEEWHDRIFDVFSRVQTDIRRSHPGLGLGLALVKAIVDAHGEQIHLESVEGQGTVFSFSLPISMAPDC